MKGFLTKTIATAAPLRSVQAYKREQGKAYGMRGRGGDSSRDKEDEIDS